MDIRSSSPDNWARRVRFAERGYLRFFCAIHRGSFVYPYLEYCRRVSVYYATFENLSFIFGPGNREFNRNRKDTCVVKSRGADTPYEARANLIFGE